MSTNNDLLNLITKLKDTRLNLAIFSTSILIETAIKFELLTLNVISETVLTSLIFVTTIRLIYAVIIKFSDYLTNKKSLKNQKSETTKKLIETKETMISNFKQLDIFQLYIIQELKRQNHKNITVSSSLLTLKEMGIIYAPAVGKEIVSASLTKLSSQLLDEKLWAEFDDLKYNAAKRFFTGIQPEELKYFTAYRDNENIKTVKYHNGRPIKENNYYVFNRYSKTTLFTQPQEDTYFAIDPITKKAFINI